MTTTAPHPTPHPTIDRNLDATLTDVREQLARVDNKASLLLAFDGAALAGLASLATTTAARLPAAAYVLGGTAVLALTVAAVLLLLVVRPRLGGAAPGSFAHLARLTEDEVPAALAEDTRAANVRVLSALAVAKYQRLARSVDASLAALALLTLAAAVTVAAR